ncbi:ribosome biogenesis protein Nop53/GLTSCR2 [Cyathus striatus]|nr:ribosome biogenesis protein Nop53/GLTSCR2 [Cyathus striatus]
MAPSKFSSSKSAKSFAKAEEKTAKSSVGAPSQLNQSSRKGKKAWRKNVDIQDVEQGLEDIRTEERVTGVALHKTQDRDLFQIDTTGDDNVRKLMPKKASLANLTSLKILHERSAVPAVFSRTIPSQKRKSGLNAEEQERLLRMAKRPRKGPFNSVMDPTEFGRGSAVLELSEAVKMSGAYDPWTEGQQEEESEEEELGMETVKKRKVKPPPTKHIRELIQVPAIVEPHQGTSYNPPVEAHQELLLQAVAAERKRLEEVERDAQVKRKMENARHLQQADGGDVAPGMKLDSLNEEADRSCEEEFGSEDRKTKKQKITEKRVLAEKRALAARAANKRFLASIYTAKSIRKSNARTIEEREAASAAHKAAELERIRKKGLAGQRLGRHKVPEGEIEVQLGEDLTESLRGLKPEGNLFRDRWLSLQQRALVEARLPVIPKKRRNRIIEYEKHAWKRFDRE